MNVELSSYVDQYRVPLQDPAFTVDKPVTDYPKTKSDRAFGFQIRNVEPVRVHHRKKEDAQYAALSNTSAKQIMGDRFQLNPVDGGEGGSR